MNSNRNTIKKIRLKKLAEFARHSMGDSAFESVAPISLIRAESQARNPAGEPEDVALLTVFHENRCVGYHGLLPGLLQAADQRSKIYWLVTFYVDPEFRGKGYGKRLVAEILTTGVDLVTTGITRGAEAVYRSVGFRDLGELSYFQLQPSTPDLFAAALDDFEPAADTFMAKSVHRISKNLDSTGSRRNDVISFQRNLETINWMIANPWVISRSKARKDVERYHFSRVRDRFEFIAHEIYEPGGQIPKGYTILSVSRKADKSVAKILDFQFEAPDDAFIAGYLGLKYAAEARIGRLEYPAGLNFFFADQPAFKLSIKRKKRLYLYRPSGPDSPLAILAPRIELNYCDSDTAFT